MMQKSPFKFLDSYTSTDKDIFFGREHELEELHQKVFSAKELILYGSSGTGKTSLVQCGLASKFAETDWMPILIRRGDDINTAVKNAMTQVAVTPIRKAKSMASYVRSVYLDFFKPIFLIFDQFEELFVFGNDNEINNFITDLKECLDSDISCRFIFVIRGEYLENIARFEEAIPDFFQNRMRVERMTRSNATRVIVESCKAFNIQHSEKFPSLLLERLSPSKATVELTYLQVYLDKLYKNANANNNSSTLFDEQLLKKSGMIEDVLSEFLEEQVANTKEPETAMTILKAFVSGEGTKKPCTVEEVKNFCISIGKNTEEEKLISFLKQFVDLRILKDKDETERYELRHDALANKIFEQISLVEKELLEVRQFFISRFADFQKRNVLLSEADLNYLAPYVSKLFLDGDQKQFFEKSRSIILRNKNRRRNIALIIVSFVLILFAGFTVIALRERNAAVTLSKIAEQKTQEALNQKELSEKAKEMALKASKEAMDAKSYAELQTNIANEQKKIAEQQSQEALKQSSLANQQKLNALQQEELAKQQSKEALKQKLLADSASAEANRLRLISIAQSVTLKSQQVKDNPQLASLLACTAYKLVKENKGNIYDPQLYESLVLTYPKLNSNVIKSLVKLNAPIKCSVITPDSIIEIFCSDGNIYSIKQDGTNSGNISIPNTTTGLDIAFFSNDGKYLVLGYTDFSIKLIDVKNSATPLISAKENKGLIRTIAFNNDNNLFATAGRDSLVVIWNNKKAIGKINLPSRVRSLVFSNDNSIVYAGCEDGNIYSVNIENKNYTKLYHIEGARVQVLQIENNYLIAGCSNGVLSFYDLQKEKFKSEFNLGNSIEFININMALNFITVGCNNQVIFSAYLMNDFSLIPCSKTDALNPAPNNSFLLNDGSLIMICADNSLLKRNVSRDWLFNNSLKLLKRDLTKEEWNEYIGSDVPYEKLINP